MSTLKVATPNERDIMFTREFNYPCAAVYDALTKPDLIRQWLTGPPGWTMTECIFEPRAGGKYRYAWSHEDGRSMGMGGDISELVPRERIVATEKFDEPWYPGEAIDKTLLVDHGSRTTLIMTVRYESRDARDMVLKTPMADGMSAGYDKLEALLANPTSDS